MTTRKDEARIDRAFSAVCVGFQIPMLELPKIARIGRDVLAAGGDDEMMRRAMLAHIEAVGVRT